MSRGKLRVYLGAAPGVGKTYKMLDEGKRRLGRGTDVVVALVETHGRQLTAERLEGFEIIPRKEVTYRGSTFTEMDLDAVLARRPEVALVDELAHTNIPGGRNEKRWQDIQELLDAGITVLTTVNIQHLDSLNDVVQQITGVPQRETVPDEIVRAADQIEIVDMAPEALRRRMAHGNVYPPEKVDAALGNYFRQGNLTALRELALLWLAGEVDEQLDKYRAQHNIDRTWEARERVVVALTGGPEGDTLIRRAARIAGRTKGADLMGVHVARHDGLSGADPAHLAQQRNLLESLGGTYHQVVGDDVPSALLDFARGVNATQLVLGASRRGRFAQIFSPGVGVTTTAESGPIDVHLVTHEETRKRRWRRTTLPSGLTRTRRVAGFITAIVLLPLLTLVLDKLRGEAGLPTDILLFLAAVVGVALIGGLYPALLAATGGFLLLNWYFTPPIYEWTIAEGENVIALIIFLLVAVGVATVVEIAARRTSQAARAGADAATLATLAGSVLRGERPLPALLERLRESFGLQSVTLLEVKPEAATNPDRHGDPAAWTIAEESGDDPASCPRDGDTEVPIDDTLTLVLRGRPLAAADQRIVEAFAAQAAVALRQQRLAEQAAAAVPLAEADKLRTALLAAVSHDLRTPLAAAKTAVASLRATDVQFTEAERGELLDTAHVSLDRLDRLVANLLDMSRVQAGALTMTLEPVAIEEIVPRALDDLARPDIAFELHLPDDLPDALGDATLLERVLVNVIANAVRYSPDGRAPMITASAHQQIVEIRVIDHGPGVSEADRDRIFAPFQRLGDRDNSTGVGLGLALSRGLMEAMGGDIQPDNTPGGGLTMIITLPAVVPAGTADSSVAS